MTPPLALQPEVADTIHLTGDQFSELLARSAQSAGPVTAFAEAHLLCCEQCAAELANLRESLSLFRQACCAHAENELRRLPQMPLPTRGTFAPALNPAYWVAAAAIFLAALLPMQMLRQHAVQSAPAISAGLSGNTPESESNEALLEDVNRDLSASVPAPMQALDPTASASSTAIESPTQTSDQRKD